MLKNILIFSVIFSSMASEKDLNDIVPHIEYSYGTILVNTIDGQLNALHSKNGKTKWTLQGDPVLRSPTVVKQGFTFLSNPRDGSLYTLKEGVLKRLPLNIPALVHAAPLKSNDGVLYAGSKRDVWLEINPVTGTEMDTMSTTTERVCPVNNHNGIFVGGSSNECSITLANNDYPYRHYVSHGNVLAVGLEGNIIWERDFGQPIVAMYLLQDDGLHKLHFTAMGGETLDNVVKVYF
ncbi:hypothetical protein DICVIV_09335 [Dictyocaulus viviparus]|uniref:PQQ enzyme repeat protein n=1 Tax=Dictyocaulus viviparus TaxID=29172 RepID=A0A0D8XLK9_DICVI|nr:hypothetical protein DICVIV_09335 [Dictyocaulus viviparus]